MYVCEKRGNKENLYTMLFNTVEAFYNELQYSERLLAT